MYIRKHTKHRVFGMITCHQLLEAELSDQHVTTCHTNALILEIPP